MPITWQNIRYSNPAEAAQPMALATQVANNALAPLTAALGKMETTADYNWQNEKKNYTNEARQAIMSQFTDPNELAAAMKDGRVDALLNAHGPQIDKPALLDFIDKRAPELQQRAIQGYAYQNAKADFEQQGIKDEIQTLFQSKNPVDQARAQALLDQHNELRNRSMVQQFGNQAIQQNIVWDRDAKKFELDQRKGENEIKTSMINALANQTSAGAAVMQARNAQGQLQLGQRNFIENMGDKYLERDQKLRTEAATRTAYNNPLSPEGIQMLRAQIKETAPDPETAILWNQAALEAAKQPGATVGTTMQTLMGMDKNRLYKVQGIQTYNAGEAARALATSPENKAAVEASAIQLQRIQQQMEEHAKKYRDNVANNWGLTGLPMPKNNPIVGWDGKDPAALINAGVAKTAANQADAPTYTVDSKGQLIEVNPGKGASRDAPAAPPQKPVTYTPPTTAQIPVAQAVAMDPKVAALRSALSEIQAKRPENRTIEDRRILERSQAMLDTAIQEATARARAVARAQSQPNFDPRVIANAVNINAMSPMLEQNLFSAARR